jgi:hypothetical protein
MKEFDWAIIGGGITGIVLSEILTREGHSVILIEKEEKLASITTRDFHEWIHTGSLYTLVPDNLKTLKFLLGAMDDLLEYYSSFERMNLTPTESGLMINDYKGGWFQSNFIHFKYRIEGRKITFPWLIGVARSIFLLQKIHKHDWLRRRAGELDPFRQNRIKGISTIFRDLLTHKEVFKTIKTTDFTTDSRALLRDLVTTAMYNGLELSTGKEVLKIEKESQYKNIICKNGSFKAQKIAICAGSGVENFSRVKITTSFAPLAVVSGVPESAISFVELDYYPKNCINMLTKGSGVGLAGGISLKDRSKCDDYLDYVIKRHQLLNPTIKEIERYIGIKSEITFEGEPRSYLYHIVETEENVWSVLPGKFTLGFSLAPEFYRRIYKKNPRKTFKTYKDEGKYSDLVSETFWMDSKSKNGVK